MYLEQAPLSRFRKFRAFAALSPGALVLGGAASYKREEAPRGYPRGLVPQGTPGRQVV